MKDSVMTHESPLNPSPDSRVPDLSVVVPVYDERDNVGVLAEEIDQALTGHNYEMIFINDASKDDTLQVLQGLKTRYPALRVLNHRHNAGQSRALRTGILAANAAIIATLDGDGQNDPADIPTLYAQLIRKDAPPALALVGGRRVKRQDSFAKRFASRFGNGVRKKLLKDNADDTGCGLKVFKREAFLRLPYFDHIHRYIPALMLREGYVAEFSDVNHRPREHGRSKYTNWGRLIVSVSDLTGVMWLNRRARNPQGWDEF